MHQAGSFTRPPTAPLVRGRGARVKLNVKKRPKLNSVEATKRLHDPAGAWSNGGHHAAKTTRPPSRAVRPTRRSACGVARVLRLIVRGARSGLCRTPTAGDKDDLAPDVDPREAPQRPSSTPTCLRPRHIMGGRERETRMSRSTGHMQRSSLRVLDVEERRREVQVRFRDVRRPERAAVADGLARQAVHVVTMSNGPRARRVREATGFIGIKQ